MTQPASENLAPSFAQHSACNLGFGEKAARRQTAAQFERAKYEKLRVLDQVAREIDEASSRVELRRQRVAVAERAIQSALDSFDRNVGRIRDGEGLPIEVLQSVTALESARRNYLRAVADHNEAQFELQWALGWPVNTPVPMNSAGSSTSVAP